MDQPRIIIPNYEPSKIRFYPYYDVTYLDDTYTLQATATATIAFLISGNQVLSGSGGFSFLEAGDIFKVTGTTYSNAVYTVSTATSTVVNVVETISHNETSSTALVSKRVDILHLEVSRLPIADIAINAIATTSPEIDTQYHFGLVDGILSYAYLKRDTETYNVQEAERYKRRFQEFIDDINTDQVFALEEEPSVMNPHYGAI
jgi:hypothetical protein